MSDQQGQEAHYRWEQAQRAAAQGSAPDPEPVTEPVAPPVSASKDEWVRWAVSRGADSGEAERATKQQLVDQYGAGGPA